MSDVKPDAGFRADENADTSHWVEHLHSGRGRDQSKVDWIRDQRVAPSDFRRNVEGTANGVCSKEWHTVMFPAKVVRNVHVPSLEPFTQMDCSSSSLEEFALEQFSRLDAAELTADQIDRLLQVFADHFGTRWFIFAISRMESLNNPTPVAFTNAQEWMELYQKEKL